MIVCSSSPVWGPLYGVFIGSGVGWRSDIVNTCLYVRVVRMEKVVKRKINVRTQVHK